MNNQTFNVGDGVIDKTNGWGVVQSGNDTDGYKVGFGDILAPDDFPVHIIHCDVVDLTHERGKPAALGDGDTARVTWEELVASERNAMLMADKSPFFPFMFSELYACERLANEGLLVESEGEYTLTPAGRALLPNPDIAPLSEGGRGYDTTVVGCTRCHVEAAVAAGLCAGCVGALQAENAEAWMSLAREVEEFERQKRGAEAELEMCRKIKEGFRAENTQLRELVNAIDAILCKHELTDYAMNIAISAKIIAYRRDNK